MSFIMKSTEITDRLICWWVLTADCVFVHLCCVCLQIPSRACCHPGPTGASVAWRVGGECEHGSGCWSRILQSASRSWSRPRSACCLSAVSDWSPKLLLFMFVYLLPNFVFCPSDEDSFYPLGPLFLVYGQLDGGTIRDDPNDFHRSKM